MSMNVDMNRRREQEGAEESRLYYNERGPSQLSHLRIAVQAGAARTMGGAVDVNTWPSEACGADAVTRSLHYGIQAIRLRRAECD